MVATFGGTSCTRLMIRNTQERNIQVCVVERKGDNYRFFALVQNKLLFSSQYLC
jgi:hypothetical protein